MTFLLCILFGLLHSVPGILCQEPEKGGSNDLLVRVERGEHSFLNPKNALDKISIVVPAGTAIPKKVQAHVLPVETVSGCKQGKNPTYAKASCTTVPGRVICQLGRYTFVINNGEHKMEPEVIERFAAMLFHRTQEGDTNFEVMVDTPAREQAYCPEQTLVSADEQQQKQEQNPSSGQELPVYVECTPVAQPGCKAQPLTEVVYSCRKRGLGIGKRAVISVDSSGRVSDGKLVLPYFRLRKRSIEPSMMPGDSIVKEDSRQLTPEVKNPNNWPMQGENVQANLLPALKLAEDENYIDESLGSIESSGIRQSVAVDGNAVVSDGLKTSDLGKGTNSKLPSENSDAKAADQTEKNLDKNIIEKTAESSKIGNTAQSETNMVVPSIINTFLATNQQPLNNVGSNAVVQNKQNSASNAFEQVAQTPVQQANQPVAQNVVQNSNEPIAQNPVQQSNGPAAQIPVQYSNAQEAQNPVQHSNDPVKHNAVQHSNEPVIQNSSPNPNESEIQEPGSNSNVPAVPYSASKPDIPAPPYPAVFPNSPGSQNYLFQSMNSVTPNADPGQNSPGTLNSISNSNVAAVPNPNYNPNAPVVPYSVVNPNEASSSNSFENPNLKESNIVSESPKSSADSNAAQPVSQKSNSYNEQGDQNSATGSIEQKQLIPETGSAIPVAYPEKKESSGVMRSVMTHIKSSVISPLKMVGYKSVSHNPTEAAGGKSQEGVQNEISPMTFCKVIQATMDSEKVPIVVHDANKLNEGDAKNLKSQENNIIDQFSINKEKNSQVKIVNNFTPVSDLGTNLNRVSIDTQKTGEQEKGGKDSLLVDKKIVKFNNNAGTNNDIPGEKTGEASLEQNVESGKAKEMQISDNNNIQIISETHEPKANMVTNVKSQPNEFSETAKMENSRESFRDTGNAKQTVNDAGKNILYSPSAITKKLEGAEKVINQIKGALNTMDQVKIVSQKTDGLGSASNKPNEPERSYAEPQRPEGQIQHALSNAKSEKAGGNTAEVSTFQKGQGKLELQKKSGGVAEEEHLDIAEETAEEKLTDEIVRGALVEKEKGREMPREDAMAAGEPAPDKEGGEAPRGENLAGFYYQTELAPPQVRAFTDFCLADLTVSNNWCPLEGIHGTTCDWDTEYCVTRCEDNINKQWQGPGSVRRRDTSDEMRRMAVSMLGRKSRKKREALPQPALLHQLVPLPPSARPSW